jgi:hypothetical protein
MALSVQFTIRAVASIFPAALRLAPTDWTISRPAIPPSFTDTVLSGNSLIVPGVIGTGRGPGGITSLPSRSGITSH